MNSIIEIALAATMVAKSAIDLCRAAADLPRWGPPLGAVVFGIGGVALLAMSQGQTFTSAVIAQTILAGILAGAGAIGVTALARVADSTVVTRRGGP